MFCLTWFLSHVVFPVMWSFLSRGPSRHVVVVSAAGEHVPVRVGEPEVRAEADELPRALVSVEGSWGGEEGGGEG